MSVEATTKVTTPIASPVPQTPVVKPEVKSEAAKTPVQPKAPITEPKKAETVGTIGAGPAQGTPKESQAKKLYIVA